MVVCVCDLVGLICFWFRPGVVVAAEYNVITMPVRERLTECVSTVPWGFSSCFPELNPLGLCNYF